MSDATDIAMHITNLRAGPEYQAAIRKINPAGPDEIKRWADDPDSPEYAQLRLVIGIWERIAQVVLPCREDQDKLYPCSPVGLMWHKLEPAIRAIQTNEGTQYYAFKFEELKDDFQGWTKTPAGEKYESLTDQTICALFG